MATRQLRSSRSVVFRGLNRHSGASALPANGTGAGQPSVVDPSRVVRWQRDACIRRAGGVASLETTARERRLCRPRDVADMPQPTRASHGMRSLILIG